MGNFDQRWAGLTGLRNMPSGCEGDIGVQGQGSLSHKQDSDSAPVMLTAEGTVIDPHPALGGWGVKVPPSCTRWGGVNLEQEGASAMLAEGTWGQSHQDEKLRAACGE